MFPLYNKTSVQHKIAASPQTDQCVTRLSFVLCPDVCYIHLWWQVQSPGLELADSRLFEICDVVLVWLELIGDIVSEHSMRKVIEKWKSFKEGRDGRGVSGKSISFCAKIFCCRTDSISVSSFISCLDCSIPCSLPVLIVLFLVHFLSRLFYFFIHFLS